jgi:hypothetical protein
MALANSPEQIFAALQALPEPERLRLVERVVHEIAVAHERDPRPGSGVASVIGLWLSDVESADQMIEETFTGRERRVLRS